ncbi:MAG: DUF192 domain-containing protein [Bacillota bacterium]
MMLINTATDRVVARKVELASTFGQRLRGLMGRRGMPKGSAMLLYPCNAIHTCFMRFSIDIVFLNREGYVLVIIPKLPPFRFAGPVKESQLVVELPAGETADAQIEIGHKLKFAYKIKR